MVSEPQRMQWFGVLVCTTNMQENIFLGFCRLPTFLVHILTADQLQRREFCLACCWSSAGMQGGNAFSHPAVRQVVRKAWGCCCLLLCKEVLELSPLQSLQKCLVPLSNISGACLLDTHFKLNLLLLWESLNRLMKITLHGLSPGK